MTTQRPLPVRAIRRSFSLRVLRGALLFAIFWMLAGVAPAYAQITFIVLQPHEGRWGGPVTISTYVQSPTEVLSVVATAGGRSVPLVYNSFTTQWKGSLSLEGLPRGPYTMVIEASNAGGETAQVSRGFTYDKLPIIKIIEPVNSAIGQPDIPIKAECIDDGPTCELRLLIMDAFTTVTLNTPIDTVARLKDGVYSLDFTATDSAGQFGGATRRVFVSSSGRLSVADTFQGGILDIDAGRALTFDNTVIPYVVRLYDRAADTSQIIWTATSTSQTVEKGFLTPGNGALFVADTPGESYGPLFEWRGGALTQVANAANYSLVVKGSWAVFDASIPPCCTTTGFFLGNLTTGTNIQVANHSGGIHTDVTPDGRALFISPVVPQILEFNPNPAPGTTTQLTASAPLWSYDPLADGINVVFRRRLSEAANDGSSLVLRTQAGVEEVLTPNVLAATPGIDYQVAGGWTAFVPRDGSVWLREPDGTRRRVATRGRIEALDASGDLVYVTSLQAGFFRSHSIRYLRKADGTVRELGEEVVGTVRFIDGTPVVVGGHQLLEIPTPPTRAILAEGATGTFFSTDVAILNPAETPTPVTLRYFPEGQTEISETRTLPARSRTTIHLDEVPGLEGTSVSTHVDAPPDAPLVVERLMSWGETGYGGHLGSAVDAPRRRWYFAEGAQGFFSTFFLIANSGTAEATVHFTFLVEQGSPVYHTMKVPPASRRTFSASDVHALVNRSFATIIESDVPSWRSARCTSAIPRSGSADTAAPALAWPAFEWFHAEGATGSLFDTFILLANPHYFDTPVTLTFVTDSGVTGDPAEDRAGERPADDQHRRGSAGTGQRQRLDARPCRPTIRSSPSARCTGERRAPAGGKPTTASA